MPFGGICFTFYQQHMYCRKFETYVSRLKQNGFVIATPIENKAQIDI
jgi:hypothetical protein